MRLAVAVAFGIFAWLVTQALGLGLAGAGHGWAAPLFASIPLVLLYPLAFAAALGLGARKAGLPLLAAAAALDLALAAVTRIEEPSSFLAMARLEPAGVALWLALWSGWQLLAVATIVGKRG